MDDLDKLLERTTIEFPFPINAEEIENTLLEYLRKEFPCDINYSIQVRGNKRQGGNGYPTSERYASEFTVTINRKAPDFVSSSFRLLSPASYTLNFFRALRFDTPGCDSIEEFAGGMASGEAQLRLMDSVREKVEEYFSQRNAD